MKPILRLTKVYFPLKEHERSMEHYTAYKNYMSKLRVPTTQLGETSECDGSEQPSTSCVTYCTTFAVFVSCEWMRNSQKVEWLMIPFPYSLKTFQANLWREFGDPLVHMDYLPLILGLSCKAWLISFICDRCQRFLCFVQFFRCSMFFCVLVWGVWPFRKTKSRKT